MADFNIDVVFNGSYQFEKLQSDWNQTDSLERDFIKNKPDLVDFVSDSVTTDSLTIGGETTTWDEPEGTLSTTLPDGGSLQHGKEIFDYYTNVDTVTLVEGDVVCIKQIPGNRKAIKRLDPAQRNDVFSVVGVVTVPSIAVNAVGRVTKIGHVSPFNTAGWSDNDSLWVSAANIGKLTNVQPDAGVYSVKVGHVVVSANNGTIDVRIQVIPKVRDLSDMDGVPLNTEGQFYVLQADGTFSANKNINDYYTKIETNNLLDDKVDTSLVGAANGLATLGADGLVPSTQLPSFVDDVLEFANLAAFPVVGETGKIYVALDTNKTYRWSGSAYIYITSGAVDSVAGKTGVVTLVKGDVGLGNVDNTSDANKPISTATQTALNGKVNNTGNESIGGVKIFTSSPIVPDTPATDQSAVNKQFVVGTATSAITKAQQWAENPEDTPVETGKYSALHWATKAAESAEEVAIVAPVLDHRIDTIENVINSMNPNQEARTTASGVDVVSLPKTAANTGMQVQLFGQSAQNLVVNGDFRNGTTGWINVNSTLSASNKILSITGTGGSATPITYVTISGSSGNIYYFKTRARVTNSLSPTLLIFLQGATSGSTPNVSQLYAVQNTWYNLTAYGTSSFSGTPRFAIQTTYTSTADATGAVTEIDGNYGCLAVNLTETFGAGNEPTKEQCDLLFANYFEGSKNVLGTGRVRSAGGNILTSSFVQGTIGTAGQDIGDNSKGRTASLAISPNSMYTIQSKKAEYGIHAIVFYTESGALISRTLHEGSRTVHVMSPPTASIIRIVIRNSTNTNFTASAANGAIFIYSQHTSVYLTTPELRSKGTTKDEIRKGTNGYELVQRINPADGTVRATPTITPIAHAGLLNSNSNGTTYFEPVIADAGVYGSNIAIQLTDYPIASFESIRKYANGNYTELDASTAVIASGGLSFTHPNLSAGDLVLFTYNYNRESIGRNMTLTHYDNRYVVADTANGKVYRWSVVSTNGVPSITLTEV